MNKKKDLKPIPEGNKGLPKLPTKVRNKIGFLKEGGPVGRIPKSARRKMGFKSKSANTISDKDVANLPDISPACVTTLPILFPKLFAKPPANGIINTANK